MAVILHATKRLNVSRWTLLCVVSKCILAKIGGMSCRTYRAYRRIRDTRSKFNVKLSTNLQLRAQILKGVSSRPIWNEERGDIQETGLLVSGACRAPASASVLNAVTCTRRRRVIVCQTSGPDFRLPSSRASASIRISCF